MIKKEPTFKPGDLVRYLPNRVHDDFVDDILLVIDVRQYEIDRPDYLLLGPDEVTEWLDEWFLDPQPIGAPNRREAK